MSDNGASVELASSGFADPAYYTGDLTAGGRQTLGIIADADDGGALVALGISIQQTSVIPTPPDVTPPTVVLVSPSPGALIASDTVIVLDVTDNGSLGPVVVSVTYPDGSTEVVFDSLAFTAAFGFSSRVAIAGGVRFTIKRTSGWTRSPSVRVLPVDASGNVG